MIRVLLLEDNRADAHLIRIFLSEPDGPDFRLTHVETLADARAAAAAESFDVALVDLHLPDSAGLETVHGMLLAAPRMPIVVLSGLNDEEMAVQAVQAGAQDYLVKGFQDPDPVRRAIRYAIERRRMVEDMQFAEVVFNNTDSGIMVTDAEGRIVRVNPAFTAITGYPRDEVIGQTPALLRSDSHDPGFYEEMWRTLQADGHWEGEVWNRHRDGKVYAQSLRINAVSVAGQPLYFVAVFSDITEKKVLEDQLRQQATHDSLTGLPNRQHFTERLGRLLAARAGDDRLALLFIDLDGFKAVNDTLGHAAGDQLLHVVGERLRRGVRRNDFVARLAGDEFTIILDHAPGDADLELVAAKLVAKLGAPYRLDQGAAEISASIGISVAPEHGTTVHQLVTAADGAMYAAKDAGKNAYRFANA